MKKLFNILLLAAGIIFASCNNLNSTNRNSENGTVILSIGQGERTIVPVEWNIDDENTTWYAYFVSDDYEVTKTISGSEEIELPVGTYKIILTGYNTEQATGETKYVVNGTKTGVVVSAGETTSALIYVSLSKKSIGEFSCSLSLTESSLLEEIKSSGVSDDDYYTVKAGDYNFSAYLTSVKDVETKVNLRASWAYTDENLDELVLTFEKEEIPSGYYYLTIKYVYDDNEYVVPINDALIEIADGLNTPYTISDSDFAGVVTRNLYVSNSSDAVYNGLTPEHRKEFNSAMQWLSDNEGAWTTANLYFVSTSEDDETPVYDVNVNPTSASTGDKEVHVYIESGDTSVEIYSLKNGSAYIYGNSVDGSYVPLCFTSDSAVDFSAEDTGTAPLNITLNNVVLNLTNTLLSGEKSLTVRLPSYSAFTAGTSTPFMNVIFSSLEGMAEYDVTFDADDENAEGYTVLSQTTVAETENTKTVSYYSSVAGTAGITINKFIPDFTLSAVDQDSVEVSDGDEFKYSYSTDTLTVSTSADFVEGTTYQWSINGTKVSDSTTASLTIYPAKNNYVQLGKNVVQLTCCYNGEYESQIFTFEMKYLKPADTSALLFNTSDSSSYWQTFDTAKLSSARLSDDTNLSYSEVKDFVFDNYGNVYTLTDNGGTTSSNDELSTTTGSYDVIRYSVNDDGLIDSTSTATTLYSTMSNLALIYCDNDENVLYILDTAETDNFQYRILKIENPQSTSAITITDEVSSCSNVVYYKDSTSTLKFPVNFAVYNDIVYFYKENSNDGIITTEKLNSDGSIKVSTGIDDMNLYQNILVVNDTTRSKLSNLDSSISVTVTDMQFNDGYLYILFCNNTGFDEPVSGNTYYQRGGVAKISVSDSGMTTVDWGEETEEGKITKLLGWQPAGTYGSSISGESTFTMTVYQGSTNLATTSGSSTINYFVGPRKFIAIKPKKLVIADDGWVITENGDGSSKGTIYNLNQVVTVDLESKTMTAENAGKYLNFTGDLSITSSAYFEVCSNND